MKPEQFIREFEMDKCREEFEKWLDDNNMFMNIERRFDQESNTYDYCAIRWIWESWQHQQTKVDELKLQVAEMKSRLNDAYTDGQSAMYAARQTKVDELQKRVDELQTAFKQLIEMENESISFEHDLFDKGWNQSARQTIENIYKLTGLGEQALKGEG